MKIKDLNLDLNGYNIAGAGNIHINGDITCSGSLEVAGDNGYIDVQKINANLVMRAYANTSLVPLPEAWEVIFDVSNDKPVWFDGSTWRDFLGSPVQ
jgi:hypothetical protein